MGYNEDVKRLSNLMIKKIEEDGTECDKFQREKSLDICQRIFEFITKTDVIPGENRSINVRFVISGPYVCALMDWEDSIVIKGDSKKDFQNILEGSEHFSFLPNGDFADPHIILSLFFLKDLR